jgi:hypothetical protein
MVLPLDSSNIINCHTCFQDGACQSLERQCQTTVDRRLPSGQMPILYTRLSVVANGRFCSESHLLGKDALPRRDST